MVLVHRRYWRLLVTRSQYLQTGHTALQRASSGGHLAIVRLLLGQGASLDHQVSCDWWRLVT